MPKRWAKNRASKKIPIELERAKYKQMIAELVELLYVDFYQRHSGSNSKPPSTDSKDPTHHDLPPSLCDRKVDDS